MSCIPASHSMITAPIQVESPKEESPVQRRGSRSYQIFPECTKDTEPDSSTYPEDFLYRRQRLPSIVVEPTEQSELESGELCWPPQCPMGSNDEEEDSSTDQTDGSVNGDQHKDMGMEEGTVVRRASIGPAQSQTSFARLTPPASPTHPEAAPPCLRS